MEGRFETWVRPDRGFAAWPTNDDLTLVIGGWPFAEFEANKDDIEGNYLKTLELAPEFADRVRAATREARYVGTAVLNYFRKPYGPGWALVGDAGYDKDLITGHGIHDAFRDAEHCATAPDEAFSGASPFETAMGRYQAARDQQVLPMFEFTTQLATLEPRRPTSSTCWRPCTATRRRWTASRHWTWIGDTSLTCGGPDWLGGSEQSGWWVLAERR